MKLFRVVLIESEIYLADKNIEYLETMYPDIREMINTREEITPADIFYCDSLEKDNNVGFNVEKEIKFYELQSKIHRYLHRANLPKYLLIEEIIDANGVRYYEYFSQVELYIDKKFVKTWPLTKNEKNAYLDMISEEEMEAVLHSFQAFKLGLKGNTNDFKGKVVKMRVKY